MRVMCVHAHFDDYEFTCGGTFERWRRALGGNLRTRVVVCTDGKAGHQFRTRDETGAMRLAEQRESARIGGFEFEPLLLPDGKMPREACLRVDVPLLAAIWKAIRDFQPDYLFCPPVVSDPLAGLHVDHEAVAQAVRQVAYMINVPHAFTPEYPTDERNCPQVRVPVIINTYDPYMKVGAGHDLAVDIDPVFDVVCATSYCHKSQIIEWLPWVSAPKIHPAPKDIGEWTAFMRQRYQGVNDELGIASAKPHEYFSVTAWGAVPTVEQLERDLPFLDRGLSRLDQVRQRVERRHTAAKREAGG